MICSKNITKLYEIPGGGFIWTRFGMLSWTLRSMPTVYQVLNADDVQTNAHHYLFSINLNLAILCSLWCRYYFTSGDYNDADDNSRKSMDILPKAKIVIGC